MREVPSGSQVTKEDMEGFDVGRTRDAPTGGDVTDSVYLHVSSVECENPSGADPVQSPDTAEPRGTVRDSVESTSSGLRHFSQARHPPIQYE